MGRLRKRGRPSCIDAWWWWLALRGAGARGGWRSGPAGAPAPLAPVVAGAPWRWRPWWLALRPRWRSVLAGAPASLRPGPLALRPLEPPDPLAPRAGWRPGLAGAPTPRAARPAGAWSPTMGHGAWGMGHGAWGMGHGA
jgi:hypothetical protein